MLLTPSQINAAFADCGFIVEKRPQSLLSMVLHRCADQAALRKLVEAQGRLQGLIRWLGSPIIVRADRCAPRA